jgi:DNA-binding MarR family transcriptional regulator
MLNFLPEDSVGYKFAVLSGRISAILSRRLAADLGLTMAEWSILAALAHARVSSVSEVSKITDLERSKVSRKVGLLVSAGLVRQIPDPEDGRAWTLTLTRKGEILYRRSEILAMAIQTQVSTSLSHAELLLLKKAVARLGENGGTTLLSEGDPVKPYIR